MTAYDRHCVAEVCGGWGAIAARRFRSSDTNRLAVRVGLLPGFKVAELGVWLRGRGLAGTRTRTAAARQGTTDTTPLTHVSQTGDEEPDSVVLDGRVMDPDLLVWMSVDSLDVRHETTDQKVGGSSPSECANVRGRFRIRDRHIFVQHSNRPGEPLRSSGLLRIQQHGLPVRRALVELVVRAVVALVLVAVA